MIELAVGLTVLIVGGAAWLGYHEPKAYRTLFNIICKIGSHAAFAALGWAYGSEACVSYLIDHGHAALGKEMQVYFSIDRAWPIGITLAFFALFFIRTFPLWIDSVTKRLTVA